MNEQEQAEFAARYATWTDAALRSALTTDRTQYRPEILPLLEAELRRRNAPLPAPVTEAHPSPDAPSPHPASAPAAPAFLLRLRWSRLTWVGRGYLMILAPMLLPWPGMLLIRVIAALIGCKIVGHHLETGGEVPSCLILGTDISPLLNGVYAMLGWAVILGVLLGLPLLLCFTGVVAMAWVWRKCRSRSSAMPPSAKGVP